MITYQLKERSDVNLAVFDSHDRRIALLIDEVEDRGEKSVNFNTIGLASGEYYYRLYVRTVRLSGKSKSYIQKKKLLIIE